MRYILMLLWSLAMVFGLIIYVNASIQGAETLALGALSVLAISIVFASIYIFDR